MPPEQRGELTFGANAFGTRGRELWLALHYGDIEVDRHCLLGVGNRKPYTAFKVALRNFHRYRGSTGLLCNDLDRQDFSAAIIGIDEHVLTAATFVTDTFQESAAFGVCGDIHMVLCVLLTLVSA